MKKAKSKKVSGVVAGTARPTPFAAALVATAVTFPFAVAVVLFYALSR